MEEKLNRTIDQVQSIDIRCTDSSGKKIIIRYPVLTWDNAPSFSINFEPSFCGYSDVNISFESALMQIIEIAEEE